VDTTGAWFWTCGHVVGNERDGFTTNYCWNGGLYATRQQAIRAGLKAYDSDDFNVGRIDKNRTLVWFGWMDEQHPEEDYAEVAEALGLPVEWA
jgi:hypothetical protein